MRFVSRLKVSGWKSRTFVGIFLVFVLYFASIFVYGRIQAAQTEPDNSECLACHEDATLKSNKHGKAVSVYVNEKKLKSSVHSKAKCVDCHADLRNADLPHGQPKKAQCGSCHKDTQYNYDTGLHGRAAKRNDPLAPTCNSCHGSHEITKVNDQNSPVSPIKVPFLCGKCHKEGTPVQLQRNIPETHILENYTESIHGKGLLEKGLVVAATCASCHTAHAILPHTDNRSSIARVNIAKTCTKCHGRIEDVHKKVVNGQRWEKEAHVLPACVDCHQPHKIRKVFYQKGLADQECLSCHEKPGIKSSKDGRTLSVNHVKLRMSVHSTVTCSQCHTDVMPSNTRPCESIVSKVNCASCHENIGKEYMGSAHGKLAKDNDKDAPTCSTCHGDHDILSRHNPASKVFPVNIPKLCAQCHQDGHQAAIKMKNGPKSIDVKYTESIHGKRLTGSGLTVTATCADCHTAHNQLNHNDTASSTNYNNIVSTCGKCHYGIQQKFDKSIHSPLVSNSKDPLPTCKDCHSAHTISDTKQNSFRFEILNTCGKCHKQISETYFDTYHGKVSLLGSNKSAKCYDCHGSHDILKVTDENSHLSRKNIVQTCQKCHTSATRKFTGYLTHATHHDPVKYPWLFIVFWAMSSLLIGTFLVSWTHTMLWLPRSLQMRKKIKVMNEAHRHDLRVMRFTPLNRALHISMIISFISLASTGLLLKFSYTGFARSVIVIFGSVENAGVVHRLAAGLLITVFIVHVIDIIRKKTKKYGSWKQMLWNPESLLFNKKDLKDFIGSIKWFIGIGPRPSYGKWTYWEKFDYFAVFWGIFVIGSTGLTLWFPEFFTKLLPGEILNIATIVHSDEALLAVGFIFTVHFFNTHFRPEKFPMDTVVFTGSYPLEEFKYDRPEEYKQLVESGELEKYIVPPPTRAYEIFVKIFGWTALTLGISIIVFIIYSMLFYYK